MKLGAVTKLDKRNMATFTRLEDDVMLANCDVLILVNFTIYGQFGVILKLNCGHMVVKLKFSLIVTFYLTKTENRTKYSNTALILLI